MTRATVKKIHSVVSIAISVAAFVPITIALFMTLWESNPSIKGITITIDNPSHVSGVDVYCNGVYLGQTPTKITGGETMENIKKGVKIPKWTKPPRQECFSRSSISSATSNKGSSVDRLKYSFMTYTPLLLKSLNDLKKDYSGKQSPTIDLIKKSHYWFRFEKEGCRGVSEVNSNRLLLLNPNSNELRFAPDPWFSSTREHLRLLLFSLRRSEYIPSEEWLKHANKYLGLLYHPMRKEAENDERVQAAIEAIVDYRYGFNDSMDSDDYRRIVKEILDRTEKNGYFEIPSPDSEAMLRATPHALDYIAEEYLRCADSFTGRERTDGLRYSGTLFRIQRQGKNENRLLPLEYAIEYFHPPQVFNRLVYEYTRNNSPVFIKMLANYPTPQGKRFFDRCLKKFDPHKPYANIDPLTVFPSIHNPDRENAMMDFVNRYERKNQWYLFNEFYNSRFHQPNIDTGALGASISRSSLSKYDKLRLLVQIQDKQTYLYIQYIDADRETLTSKFLFRLQEHPNPYYEDFLIETYDFYKQSKTLKELNLLMRVSLRCNTQKLREQVLEIVGQNPESQKGLIHHLGYLGWFSPILPYWTEYLAHLENAELRLKAVEVLEKTDTNESRAVLSDWANDPNESIRKAARAAIRNFEETRLRAKKLLAGEITPDDLIPPAEAYVWNGEDYVKEGEEVILSP